MFKELKIKLNRLKTKFSNYQFELFGHRVQVRLHRIPEGKRIVWLANMLMNEIESQGNCITSAYGNCVDVDCFNKKDITVRNILTKFTVGGERDITI